MSLGVVRYVLSGFLAARRSSRMSQREGKKIKEFGYTILSESDHRRLACQAQALGAVSIVIPPWNGVWEVFETNGKN